MALMPWLTSQAADWVEPALGPLGLLVFLLVVVVYGGAVKRWWVFGWQYNEAVKDRDRYRDLAERSTTASEKVANIAKEQDTTRLQEIAKLVSELTKERTENEVQK